MPLISGASFPHALQVPSRPLGPHTNKSILATKKFPQLAFSEMLRQLQKCHLENCP